MRHSVKNCHSESDNREKTLAYRIQCKDGKKVVLYILERYEKQFIKAVHRLKIVMNVKCIDFMSMHFTALEIFKLFRILIDYRILYVVPKQKRRFD